MIYFTHCTVTSIPESFECAKFSAFLEADTRANAELKLKALITNSTTLQRIRPPLSIYLESMVEVKSIPEAGIIGHYEQIYLNSDAQTIGEIPFPLPDNPSNCDVYNIEGGRTLMSR